ncbi:MAG: TonB-dependent receptor [Campylobacterales bacterium]|nr:TonB-dependent receptor [Campylobacterales bacterium]
MHKLLLLSLIASSVLLGTETELEKITVESTKVDDLDGSKVRSADLAEALVREVPSVSMIRRSAVSNDVTIRGQKRDNINVTIDGARVCGACPNRMDPPISHVLTNNIDSIEVLQGPYDVTQFGTLGGGLNIHTKEPSRNFGGAIDLSVGSWNQRKAAATLTGGNEFVRLLVSASAEGANQYVDGNGDTLAEQIDAYAAKNPTAAMYKLQDPNQDAYTKKSLMSKAEIDLSATQRIKLGATFNVSSDILYPTSPMDAIKDDSTIYTAAYELEDLGSISELLELSAYHSHVWHPMSNAYRISSKKSGKVFSNELNTRMEGFAFKNATRLSEEALLTLGADYSVRMWDGNYKSDGMIVGRSISETETAQIGLFAKMEHEYRNFNLRYGVRFDSATVSPDAYARPQGIMAKLDPWQENDYSAITANLQADYAFEGGFKLFGGIGRGYRVPDARELYILNQPITTAGDPNMGKQLQTGTPDLEATTNHQADLGVKYSHNSGALSLKTFYNMLSDYIYYNATKVGAHKFENIDATIYGVEASLSQELIGGLSAQLGAAWQRGQKDEALAGQNDKDLADIPPLKGRAALVYDYAPQSFARVELLASDAWSAYDSDNGEQRIDAYGVVNLKLDHRFDNGLGIALGIDNLFDETYALSNTYKDLILISGNPDADIIMMNEPGRYYNLNLSMHF